METFGTFPSLENAESNPFAKCQSQIDVNIFVNVLSSKSAIETTFICRVNLSVISFRPPPGGHIAVTRS